MTINLMDVFSRGGRESLDLLSHCVFSVNTDALFVFLVREYQQHAQAVGAVALHDMFCAAGAPAKISDDSLIAPKDARLQRNVEELRRVLLSIDPGEIHQSDEPAVESDTNESEESDLSEEKTPAIDEPVVPMPPRFLFDAVANRLTSNGSKKIAALVRYYDPALTPIENLPKGELSVGQRAFVDNIWTPMVRPHLVTAGFWRVATVG